MAETTRSYFFFLLKILWFVLVINYIFKSKYKKRFTSFILIVTFPVFLLLVLLQVRLSKYLKKIKKRYYNFDLNLRKRKYTYVNANN